MATFTNFATLSYNGLTRTSNTVTGEILETVTAYKTPLSESYTAGSEETYVVSLANTGETPVTGLTVTDDLGGYLFGDETVYPLAYQEGSLRYFSNGILQSAPAVTAGPPLVISGLSIPANGNIVLVYQTTVTAYAPLGTDASIDNTITADSGSLSGPVTATATLPSADGVELQITKAIAPAAISPNGFLTYTFVIENYGNEAAAPTDEVIMSDTFDPILSNLSVTFDGASWTENTNYTYNANTGVFSSLPGQISVPAANYTQNPDGTWAVAPGTATLSITGNVQSRNPV